MEGVRGAADGGRDVNVWHHRVTMVAKAMTGQSNMTQWSRGEDGRTNTK